MSSRLRSELAGDDDFIKHVEKLVSDRLKISKIERKKLRFTGIDIEKKSDGIHVSMEDYAKSIELIPVFRKDKDTSPLTPQELKLYRKYVGKFLWLSENVRPDLAFLALDMARKVQKAVLKDLKEVNKNVIKQLQGRENKVIFKPVCEKKNLIVRAVCDAAFYTGAPAIQGNIIMLADKDKDRVSPPLWKSKQITRVCKSSKDAETRAGGKFVEDSVYLAQRIEEVLFGDIK